MQTTHRLLPQSLYHFCKEIIMISMFAISLTLVYIQFAARQITMIECNVQTMSLQTILLTSQHTSASQRVTETYLNKITERNISMTNLLQKLLLLIQLAIILLHLEMEFMTTLTGHLMILTSFLATGGLMTMEQSIQELLDMMKYSIFGDQQANDQLLGNALWTKLTLFHITVMLMHR